MRIGRVMDLLNRSRVQEGFERQVVADAPQQIEKRVNELIDWMVDADFRQWQRITRHLSDRRREFRDRIVGTVRDDEESRPFHDERRRMMFAYSSNGLSHCKEEDTPEPYLLQTIEAFLLLVDKVVNV